jgi:hypothetical protein
MAHSYSQNLIHCVYNTEGRRNLIKPDLQPALWALKGSIANNKAFTSSTLAEAQTTRTY